MWHDYIQQIKKLCGISSINCCHHSKYGNRNILNMHAIALVVLAGFILTHCTTITKEPDLLYRLILEWADFKVNELLSGKL